MSTLAVRRRPRSWGLDLRCASRSAILAAVDRGHLTVEDRLIRIRSLLKGIPGPLGGGLLAWADTGDVGSMPQDVLGLIVGSAERLEEGWTPGGTRDDIPRDAADLMTKLTEVDEAKGIKTLVWVCLPVASSWTSLLVFTCHPTFIKLVRSRADVVELAGSGRLTGLDLPGSQKGWRQAGQRGPSPVCPSRSSLAMSR